jgi:hypothetical protein
MRAQHSHFITGGVPLKEISSNRFIVLGVQKY